MPFSLRALSWLSMNCRVFELRTSLGGLPCSVSCGVSLYCETACGTLSAHSPGLSARDSARRFFHIAYQNIYDTQRIWVVLVHLYAVNDALRVEKLLHATGEF